MISIRGIRIVTGLIFEGIMGKIGGGGAIFYIKGDQLQP